MKRSGLQYSIFTPVSPVLLPELRRTTSPEDTMALMKGEQMAADTAFLIAFAERMANAVRCPVAREMPENMKEKLDIYLCRKRAPKQ